MQITNAKFRQALLQSTAVGERVFATAHAAPPADIAEGVHASLLEFLEKGLFGKTVNTDGDICIGAIVLLLLGFLPFPRPVSLA